MASASKTAEPYTIYVWDTRGPHELSWTVPDLKRALAEAERQANRSDYIRVIVSRWGITVAKWNAD